MYSNSSTSKGQPISSENVVVQTALSIGAVNDPLEKEADTMADKVMRMPENGLIQRKCTDCEEEDKVQRKPLASFIQKKGAQGGMVASKSISNQINSSRGKGSGLRGSTKSFMESRFGTDFSNVNIHSGSEATNMSRDLEAKAFTVGNDIYFNKGQYNPNSGVGKHLLAHELTHTIQQGAISSSNFKKDPNGNKKILTKPDSSISGLNTIQRVEDLEATRFRGVVILERAFDGLVVISQNQNSVGTHVRLIQNSLLALGYNLPSGVDGDFGQETETAVRNFQIDTGATMLDGDIGSETMRLLDMQDPGLTGMIGPVAPPAPIGPIPPANTAVFSEAPNETFAGYDATTAPDSLVVPVNERRRANIAITPVLANPTFVSDTPAVANVNQIDEGIVVTGVSHGTSNIRVMEGATVLATLQITVKRQLERTVAFHFVCDSAPGPGGPHCSNGTPSADTMRALLNQVWHRQANIRFTDGGTHNIVVAGDLGTEVEGFTAAPEPEINAITAFSAGAGYNVFRVWNHHLDGASPNGASNLGNDTILADAICANDGWGLPHEAGHALGLLHGSGFIMTPCGGRVDQRVSKAMADIVNP